MTYVLCMETTTTRAHTPVEVALWGDRYFERQVDNKCGRHALNNMIGGPQFLDENLLAVCMDVVATTGERPEEHARSDGWYSHGVLAAVFDRVAPPMGRLLDRPLHCSSYHALAQNPHCLGAIVNHSNAHWTAIIKHAGALWHVNSQTWPKILSCTAYEQLLQLNPMTFVLVANELVHKHSVWCSHEKSPKSTMVLDF